MTPATTPAPPVLPDFVLHQHIGRGGFGDVWLAETVTGKRRAVKWVARERFVKAGLADAGVEALFQTEFEGVRRFEDISAKHPGLVSIHHVGRVPDGTGYFYVMPLADDAGAPGGGYAPQTLARRIATDGPLEWRNALDLLASLTRGAAALHAAGLQHGDISSANVLFIEGRAVLGDPGLTCLDGEFVHASSPGFSCADGRSGTSRDVFALGRLFFHAVTGLHPLDHYPLVPAERIDGVPQGEFGEILDHCCDPDPAARFGDAGEMLDWLVRRFPGIRPAPAPPGRGRRWVVAGSLGVALAAVGVAAWQVLGKPEPPPEQPYGGLPLRGVGSPPPWLWEFHPWHSVLVDDPQAPEPPPRDWRYGVGPVRFGELPSELPERLSWRPGKVGQCLHFDNHDAGNTSVRGYVQLDAPHTPEWSVAFWMKADGDPPSIYETTVWTLGVDSEHQLQFVLTNDLRLVLEQRGQGQRFYFHRRAPSVADLDWHHVGLTVTPRRVTVYFDGEKVRHEELEEPLRFDDTVHVLGHRQWVIGRATRYWGALDEFRHYERALDAGEIAALAAGAEVPGAVLHLPFEGNLDDGSGKPTTAVFRGASGDGTLMPARPDQKWLLTRARFEFPERLEFPLLVLNCTGGVVLEWNGGELLRHRLAGRPGPGSRLVPGADQITIPLGPMDAGGHEFRAWVRRNPARPVTRFGVSITDGKADRRIDRHESAGGRWFVASPGAAGPQRWKLSADGWWTRPGNGTDGMPQVHYRPPSGMDDQFRWLGRVESDAEPAVTIPVDYLSDWRQPAGETMVIGLPLAAAPGRLRVEFIAAPP